MVDLSQASGEHRTAPLWASPASQSYAQKALSRWASGLHGGVVPWRTLLDSQPSSERPSPGRQPRSRPKREGGRWCGRTAGWDLSLVLWGRTHCQLGSSVPTAGPVRWVDCAGTASWAGQGETPCQRPLRQVPGAQLPSKEARLQMLFLRVRPESQAFLRLPPRWPAFLSARGQLPLLISSQN